MPHSSSVDSLSQALLALPADVDLYQCGCHISDITTLAGVLGVSDDELAVLTSEYSNKPALQAVQLLKKWCTSTKGSRQDLYQFLLQLKFTEAANRLE